MKTLLTASPSGSTEGWQGIGPICGIPSAAVGDATSDDATSDRVPTAAIRHALRALASETGQLTGLRGVKLLRPLVAQAHEVLRERLEAGGSVEAYLRGRTRLADSAVIGLLHVASVSTRMRGNNMVAPLAAVAVGGYGRSELAPGSDLDLLFLLPESSQSRAGAVAPPAQPAGCFNAATPPCRRRRGRRPGARSRGSYPCYLRSEGELMIWLGVCMPLRCNAHAFGSLSRSPPAPSRPDAPTRTSFRLKSTPA